MKSAIIPLLAGCALWPQLAAAETGDLRLEGDVWAGSDVIPPDIADTGPTQDRIRWTFGTEFKISHDAGPVVLSGIGGAEIYPSDSSLNRYPLGVEMQADLPLSARTKLRLRPSYEYVLGDDGRVFDRARADVQLIHTASIEHTTTVRLRYGYRNQTEKRFTGYDQHEWLAELRHLWRPGGGETRITGYLLGLHANAEDDRYSYNGYGTMLIGRTLLAEGLEAYGRLYLVRRDYKDAFSSAYPYPRKDTQLRLTAGLTHPLNDRLALFGEAGYASVDSNVPTRDYDGFVGRVGLQMRFDLRD